VKYLTVEIYTRYERARIIGARALQIAMGAPVLLEDDSGEPIDIALKELELGVIPITVKRITNINQHKISNEKI
jgi:DNA-directed RNA polymerase subunit K